MNRLDTIGTHLQDNLYVRVERRGVTGLIRLLRSAPPRSQVGGCVLCGPMRAQILRALKSLEADSTCLVIVLASTSERFFSSGIDITDFAEGCVSDVSQQPPVPSLSELTAAVEACPKVCIAAIQGLCSSWGLELALAADYRVCTINAKFRFPEVAFGITPCGGGVRRLVCRVGVPQALEMLSYGRPVYAKEAQRIGLVDAPPCHGPQLWEALSAFIASHVTPAAAKEGLRTTEDAQAAKATARQHRRTTPAFAQLPLYNRGWYAWVAHKLRETVPRARQAPYRAVDAIRLAVSHSLRTRGAEEAVSATAAAGDADAERNAAYTAAEPAAATPPLTRDGDAAAEAAMGLRRVAVLGAGTMGTSIVLLLLWQHDMEQVVLIENDAQRRERAVEAIHAHLSSRVAAHRLSAHRCEAMLRRLHATGNPNLPFPPLLSEMDLVLECAPEVPALKRNIFAHLDVLCKRSAIFVTVSSVQDVDELAAVTRRPGQVVGIHFFPPANHSPVVEVIRGAATERWVMERLLHLFSHLDKFPVVSLSGQGYVGTRLLLAALYQAYAMLEDGCFPMQIDFALKKSFHFRRGIFELEDIMGLDSTATVRASMQRLSGLPASPAPVAVSAAQPNKAKTIVLKSPSAEEVSNRWWLPSRPVFDIPNSMIAVGALGRKTRDGWYTYATPEESTLGYALRHPIKSWLWLPSAPSTAPVGGDGKATAAPADLVFGANAVAPASPVDTLASCSSTSAYRFPLVSLEALLPQHNYSVEYRTLDSSKRHKCTRRPFRDEEIVERIVFAMVNEAAKLLSAGIITNAADIDCISVYAFGFPAWKGGLCYYADNVAGMEKVVYKMKVFNRALGSEEYPYPCTALQTMLAEKQTFASISK